MLKWWLGKYLCNITGFTTRPDLLLTYLLNLLTGANSLPVCNFVRFDYLFSSKSLNHQHLVLLCIWLDWYRSPWYWSWSHCLMISLTSLKSGLCQPLWAGLSCTRWAMRLSKYQVDRLNHLTSSTRTVIVIYDDRPVPLTPIVAIWVQLQSILC